MGGHGGLNILPQKRWNVYNYDNREKVKRDEEAAAKAEQLRREQTRRAETESRLQSLRRSKGIQPAGATSAVEKEAPATSAVEKEGEKDGEKEGEKDGELRNDARHMNLFGGMSDFDFLGSAQPKKDKKEIKREEMDKTLKREHKRFRKEEKEPKAITAEDEKHRLGYGLAGKGVNKPWYLTKRDSFEQLSIGRKSKGDGIVKATERNGSGDKMRKKSIEELREERVSRERKEKERERKVLGETRKKTV